MMSLFLGQGEGATFWLPHAGAEQATDVDWLFYVIYGISVFFFVLVVAVMLLFMWWYRRRPGTEADQSHHHNLPLEIFWTTIPVIIVVWMFWVGWEGFADLRQAPADAYKIDVVGQKWNWSFTYPNGAGNSTVDEEEMPQAVPVLLVPPNRSVELVMTSEDVLHSFFIPDFRVKQDVIPGRFTTLWFTATEPGARHRIYCTEYCGDKHSYMYGWVEVAESWEDFQARLKQLKNIWETPDGEERTPVEVGELIYKRDCAVCHKTTEEAANFPSFLVLSRLWGEEKSVIEAGSEVSVTVDADYVHESIVDPSSQYVVGFEQGGMATNWGDKLSEREIDALAQFIESLAKDN